MLVLLRLVSFTLRQKILYPITPLQIQHPKDGGQVPKHFVLWLFYQRLWEEAMSCAFIYYGGDYVPLFSSPSPNEYLLFLLYLVLFFNGKPCS